MFNEPVVLYGSSISYFTGKMENYFQIRSIPYFRTVDAYPAFERKMKKMVGIHQMPAVVLPDGRWMTDTTKMIQWFESKFNNSSILPKDPIQNFICLLIKTGQMNGGGAQRCITDGIIKKVLNVHPII